jgi:hypothetical protein
MRLIPWLFQALQDDASVNALCEARIYPDLAPQGERAPHLVLQEISDVEQSSCHSAGDGPGLTDVRMRIIAYATTRLVADDLADRVRALFGERHEVPKTSRMVGGKGYDDEARLFLERSDYQIWKGE